MNCHQILTGAVNSGDNCYSVGSVEGVPFTAYTAGCNIVVLASTFQRVQIIPGVIYGNVQVDCLDASTDVGKIAAAYGRKIVVFEPTPLLHQVSAHRLDYTWIQTAAFEADCRVSVLSWNLEGTKLLTGGSIVQMWHLVSVKEDGKDQDRDREMAEEPDQVHWNCVWQCRTASPVCFLRFSPDGTLFTSAGKSDRLVKIWYESAAKNGPQLNGQRSPVDGGSPIGNLINDNQTNDVNYSFIYIAHPRAVTGISWRKTSKYLPRGSVANMLATSCRDNICRLWVQTLLPDDGLVNFSQIEGLANNIVPGANTQRHRQKILQRLKLMKFNQFKKRQTVEEERQEIIANLPSTYSVHDFHSFGVHGTGAMVPGLHFHLAASINAETDIPLVPSLSGGDDFKNSPSFVVHWLNNKEMTFTKSAEKLLQEVSRAIIQNEMGYGNSKHSDAGSDIDGETDETDVASAVTADTIKKRTTKVKKRTGRSVHSDDHDDSTRHSRQSHYTNSSSMSTDASANNNYPNQNQISEMIDRKLETLMRNWHKSCDLLFSIYPIDGSLLVWLVEWLDETGPGLFRQAQVNFSLRIPNAIPLGDAATMSQNLALYSPDSYFDLKSTFLSSYLSPDFEDKKPPTEPNRFNTDPLLTATPTVCMLTKHNNGSLNQWAVGFGDGTDFTQVLSISHSARVCGHRFRVNDVTCHPVMPLLLTTSHHNLPGAVGGKSPGSTMSPTPISSPMSCCPLPDQELNAGFCSELILWKVDPVGPLSKSGGITELARINSPKTSAFANVAWIPTLLPSTTLGPVSNSPSACFVASDGHQLRVYQAVIDARTLLAEVSTAERRKVAEFSPSGSEASTTSGFFAGSLKEAFRIVSLQSTARPGCILELDSIHEAVHDWQNTQLLHVFQEQLIRGDSQLAYQSWNEKQERNPGLVEPSLGAVVDLRHSAIFEEPFYLVVLEKNEQGQSVIHMWRLVIGSHAGEASHRTAYVPDSNLIQESDHSNQSSRSNSPDPMSGGRHDKGHSVALPLKITTKKVCTQILPLPNDVEVIHASPAAGHLSSSNIYPACFAPYLMTTACSDGKIRFWKCKTDDEEGSESFVWHEWEMILNKDKSSAIEVPGLPVYMSCAYSGRIACAYKFGQSYTRPTSGQPAARYVNVNLAIYECESTGGSEWILEDTINLKNIAIPQAEPNLDIELGPLVDTTVRNRRTVDTLVMRLASRTEDHSAETKSHHHTSHIQRLLSVPSYTTMQSLKRIISERGNQLTLTQKSLVQLDWVSTEDGAHVLTVSAGSKISLFTPVSTDIAQANLQAMKASEKTMATPANRMLLKQTSSMATNLGMADDIRWMSLRATDLSTADGLPPLPMQLAWVRDGILVVGMDNEMLIYTQWKSASVSDGPDSVTDTRVLTEQGLLTHAQESSQLRLPSHPGSLPGSLPRSPSSHNLATSPGHQQSERKITGQQAAGNQQDKQLASFSSLPDFGIFEASRLACPVLPQYHPKQLMELLAFGKIYRVRAILGHLVACLCSMESLKSHVPSTFDQSFDRRSDSERSPRSWHRSRTLSVAAPYPTSPGGHQSPMDDVPMLTEEVELDYTEITSIRPMPLYTLIEADDKPFETKTLEEELEYDHLFDASFKSQVEETLDEILGRSAFTFSPKPKKSTEDRLAGFMTNFGPRQASVLTKLLTHSHLPGLSSLDQMHLLALADSVASFNPSVKPTATTGDEDASGPADDQLISADSLDDCGLRFLLTMRQHIYLLRCLPLVQRKQLQKKGLGSDSLVWAFHSETQEELMQLIPSVQRGNPSWNELRELGVAWWVRNNAVLRKLIEKLAKAEFQKNKDPLDAALFYLAMKKKSLVWGLFRSVQDRKMTDFFQNNFLDEKWRKAALKNAYALLGKQRFHHAAAFFLLAGAVWDAVEVCLNKLDDLQLAMVIVRLYEGDIETVPENLKRLLFQEVLGCRKDGTEQRVNDVHPDPFLRSMSYWMLQDYSAALTTLLEVDVGSGHSKYSAETESDINVNPSVFNFYLYLRTQPLIVRRQLAQNRKLAEKTDTGRDQAITCFERRLFFQTAHAHFRAGCPSLALEVLSRLPNRIVDDQKLGGSKSLDSPDQPGTVNNMANQSDAFDWGAPAMNQNNQLDNHLDWGAPVTSLEPIDTDFRMTVEPSSDDDEDEEDEGGLEMKKPEEPESEKELVKLDIMAQQLKFIACLKILMEELSTLATGFEVDGGQLRYHLYEWLERSVQALKLICNYRTFSMRNPTQHPPFNDPSSMTLDPNADQHSDRWTPRGSHSDVGSGEYKPTLHEILLADKVDFEAKLERASRRKRWLTANEALLRTLLSYCSLHGAHGGGLASVRMELILLLQELQQERSQQQLLSPLPFPTTLPLLAASVACQKTVVADPIRHLQSVTHDMLSAMIDIKQPALSLASGYSTVHVLKDLGISLSACIYQSLCDSDAVTLKKEAAKEQLTSSVVCPNTHLLAGHQAVRRTLSNVTSGDGTGEPLNPATAPNKWPGVQSLRALLARDKDEDSPKLHTLLCESFVAVYLSQLLYACAACDSHVLYRLISIDFSEEKWSQLFGGGAKKLIHVLTTAITNQPAPVPTTATSAMATNGEQQPESTSMDLLNTLSKQRMKFHLKILQQLNQSEKPVAPPNIKEDRPTYREQFVPPQMSIISLLMTKPKLPDDLAMIDYDSTATVESEDDDFDNYIDEDVVAESVMDSAAGQADSTGEDKHLDCEVYAWAIIRKAVFKLARGHLIKFLQVSGVELQDLPTISPLIHAVFKVMSKWQEQLRDYMIELRGPPSHFLPNSFVETSRPATGPAILKYKSILEISNTPFKQHNAITKASKRLWNYLVRQEKVQDIFIRYIFGKPRSTARLKSGEPDVDGDEGDSTMNNPEPTRIIHKDTDNISGFCINRANPDLMALATPKEIQEFDISDLIEPAPWLEEEAEYDIRNLQRAPESLPSTDYIVVQHPSDRLQQSPGGLAIQTGANLMSQQVNSHGHGHGHQPTNKLMLKRHKTEGVRRLCAHPTLPLYLSGSQDGAVILWEWNHQQPISCPRPAGTFAKVTRVGFNAQGNKFAVADGDGNLSLWQVALGSTGSKPFLNMQCHSKQVSDFTFLGSSSIIVTAGQSTDHKNVALWDTLLPIKKRLVTSFACHEQHGASAILYAPQNQLLITGGKKGDVHIFDVRQRQQRNKFVAHENAAIKCMALDPAEDFFVTGSADGDIKVWGLTSVNPLYSFPGEHARSTLFRNIGMGVSHLYVDASGRLFSCGADGSMKLRQLPDRCHQQQSVVNSFC